MRWRRVILPLVAAPALSAFLFVFVLSASDYVTPQFVGGSSGVMLGVQVQANFTTVGNYPLGAATSLLMLAADAGFFWTAAASAKTSASHLITPGYGTRSPLMRCDGGSC